MLVSESIWGILSDDDVFEQGSDLDSGLPLGHDAGNAEHGLEGLVLEHLRSAVQSELVELPEVCEYFVQELGPRVEQLPEGRVLQLPLVVLPELFRLLGVALADVHGLLRLLVVLLPLGLLLLGPPHLLLLFLLCHLLCQLYVPVVLLFLLAQVAVRLSSQQR
jgi:hypothetical protein